MSTPESTVPLYPHLRMAPITEAGQGNWDPREVDGTSGPRTLPGQAPHLYFCPRAPCYLGYERPARGIEVTKNLQGKRASL